MIIEYMYVFSLYVHYKETHANALLFVHAAYFIPACQTVFWFFYFIYLFFVDIQMLLLLHTVHASRLWQEISVVASWPVTLPIATNLVVFLDQGRVWSGNFLL